MYRHGSVFLAATDKGPRPAGCRRLWRAAPRHAASGKVPEYFKAVMAPSNDDALPVLTKDLAQTVGYLSHGGVRLHGADD